MKTILRILLFVGCVSFAAAEPLKLKNIEANELLGALSQIGPGLTAQNTTRAARDINTLRVVVDAWSKGEQAARQRLKVSTSTKIDSPEGQAYLEEQKKNNLDESSVELQRLVLTDEEITNAKISPQILSVILRYLDAKAK